MLEQLNVKQMIRATAWKEMGGVRETWQYLGLQSTQASQFTLQICDLTKFSHCCCTHRGTRRKTNNNKFYIHSAIQSQSCFYVLCNIISSLTGSVSRPT